MKSAILSFLLLFITAFTTAQNFSPPEWSYNKSIYEVNVRQYTPEGTFNAFAEHLPRLKEMGVGIVWLMPIHPIGEKNRKGSMGSYYSVKDYFGINPEFGTEDDFRNLIAKTQELGMYLIIDWVANHTAWDNPWVAEHPDWFTKDEKGNMVPPVDDWSDVVDLNFNNKELWAEMTSALRYWVEEFNIDGYRCDVAGMVPLEFWPQAREELEKIKNVFMLAEWDTPEMHKAFDMTYAWDQHKLMNRIAIGEANAEEMKKYFIKEKSQYPESAFRMRFTSNHDENTWNGTVFERLGSSAEMFAVFTCLIEGMPLIYGGQEAGLNKRLEFFEKDLIEWREHSFENIYSALLNLKKVNEALFNGERGGEMKFIDSDNPENIFAFVREKNDDKIFAIFNFSGEEVNVNLDGEEIAGSYINLFSTEEYQLTSKAAFVLPARGYMVFVNK